MIKLLFLEILTSLTPRGDKQGPRTDFKTIPFQTNCLAGYCGTFPITMLHKCLQKVKKTKQNNDTH